MIVTTAGRTNKRMESLAEKVANDFNAEYVFRNKRSINEIKNKYNSDVLVIGKERFEWYSTKNNSPFFFHPNSAIFRIKRLINKENDPFIKATGLTNGKSFLDCTLGIASDSIVASFAVGDKGKVIGLEASPIISNLVEIGLKEWDTGNEEINQAMKRIVVLNRHALDVLKESKEASFDCVYLDPMFEEPIDSDGINPLKELALYDEWTEEMINHAKRVAIDRVVLKDHFRSKRFEKYDFEQQRRKSAKFHYGIWYKNI